VCCNPVTTAAPDPLFQSAGPLVLLIVHDVTLPVSKPMLVAVMYVGAVVVGGVVELLGVEVAVCPDDNGTVEYVALA